MASRNQSGGAGAGFAVLLLIALLWWLRWLILAGVAITVVVLIAQRLMRSYDAHRAAEVNRLSDVRRRAELQNAQVLRGDPRGFFGQYPLPDSELIPRWYKPG